MRPRLLGALVMLTCGCSQTVIDGEVVDARGTPVPGATVTAAGTACSTRSDGTGHFALECEPGTHVVVVSAQGYTTKEFTQAAPGSESYDSGRHLLVRMPQDRGLHLFVEDRYERLMPGRLRRDLVEQGPTVVRAICLDPSQSEPNLLQAGAHMLFDHEHPGWRPFRLDADGCAYRDHKDAKHRWTEDYKDKPPYDVQEVGDGRSVARLQLSAGEYFIADWKGFFVGADEREQRHSYTGFWLRVE